MITTRSRRSILPAVAAVCALLCAAAPAAAIPGAWDFGGWLRGVLSSIWAEHGCNVDPSGQSGAAIATAGNGCSVSPDGRCGAAPAVEQACSLDPNGSCKE